MVCAAGKGGFEGRHDDAGEGCDFKGLWGRAWGLGEEGRVVGSGFGAAEGAAGHGGGFGGGVWWGDGAGG